MRITLVRRFVAAAVTLGVAAALAGTFWALSGSATTPGPVDSISVVATVNMWGSLAAQLGNERVTVTSIVSSPAVDPHDYEPTADDARRFAQAKLVVVNGAGYDAWAQRLLDANPVAGRQVIDVAQLAHVGRGGNPHFWYSPAIVRRAAAAIATAYRADQLVPRTLDLRAYRAQIARIRGHFAGTPVGASESVFAPLAHALGLRLLTPASFLDAVSEGTEPTAGDVAAIERQIARHEIRVWVYNDQNATPDVRRLTEAARRAQIPVVTVTETLAPASATFQTWQLAQLHRLAKALAA